MWRFESILRLVFLGQQAPAEEDTPCQASPNVPCTPSLSNPRILAFFVLVHTRVSVQLQTSFEAAVMEFPSTESSFSTRVACHLLSSLTHIFARHCTFRSFPPPHPIPISGVFFCTVLDMGPLKSSPLSNLTAQGSKRSK